MCHAGECSIVLSDGNYAFAKHGCIMLNHSFWIAFNNTFTLQHIPFCVLSKGRESEGAECLNPIKNIGEKYFT